MKVSASRNKGNRFALSAMASAVAAVTLSSVGFSASALAQAAAASADAGGAGVLEEVVVTARRSKENLQDIPVSVQAISGRQIQDLLFTQPSDISSVAAGLDIALATPTNPAVTLRGVRWTAGSGSPATPIYLNEISFDTSGILQTMYDIGQVEVLRGPQGTTRGAPSISGAVTISTHRPDLQEMGGYVQGIVGEHDRRNGQGAISIPIIEDKLAVRLAGSYDQTSANRVKSVNNPESPEIENKSVRASVRWAPTDTILIDGMYQRLEQSGSYYIPVVGPGAPGVPPFTYVKPNYSGSAIQSGDYRSVQAGYDKLDDTVEYYTLNASWDVFDKYRLSYNYGNQHTNPHSASDRNQINVLPGFTGGRPDQGLDDPEYYVHEARFSSLREADGFFDFDLGYYYQKFDGVSLFNLPVYLGGAFGPPGSAVPGAITDPYSRYTLPVDGRYTIARTLESFYGNLEFHLTDALDVTVGARTVDDKSSAPAVTDVGSAWNAIKNPVAATFSCSQLGNLSPAAAGAVDSPIYGDGYCDIPVKASSTTEGGDDDHTKTIWNTSVSYRFTDDLLAYATVGTSYRSGLPSLNNPGLPPEYLFPEPETATSYEIGVKTNWSDWLVVNADIFLIDYKDQLTQFQSIPYYNSVSGRVTNTSVAFFQNVDAQVTGGELEISAAPIENLTLSSYLSYSVIESEGGQVPCIDPTRPIDADNIINTCESEQGSNLNASPKFQASFVGNYIVPLGAYDGYLRTLVSYQGKNPNFGASIEDAKAYTTVDLFAGVTGGDGGWDVGLYAKNVFNTQVQLLRQSQANSIYPEFGASGYDTVSMTLPREVGMSMQYSFGSR